MTTEKHISAELGRTIKSPIRVGSLADLELNQKKFLEFYKPFFSELEDDLYLVRENQFAFILGLNPEDSAELEKLHQDFYSGKVSVEAFSKWTSRFSSAEKEQFELKSKVTRQRNISSFEIEEKENETEINRVYPKEFSQDVADTRTWSRVFSQATDECVENDLFYELLISAWEIIKQIHPSVTAIKITSHFMRTLSYEKVLGENSPEGVHEDGAPYIISALVINRENALGGTSQIYEKLEDGTQELIFEKVLNPGEFIFQADTGEEKTFGNDLWHYVTGISPENPSLRGVRDIIGFDIEIP